MYLDRTKLYDNAHFFNSEIVENIFIATCLEKGVPTNYSKIYEFSEVCAEGYQKDGILFILHLAEFYYNNSYYFSSIGDPELPLWDDFTVEDDVHYQALNMLFDFNPSTSLCSLKIPNILGFNEPALDPEVNNFYDILDMYGITEECDIYQDLNSRSTYYFHHTYLFSEDIDFAIDNGHKDKLLSDLEDVNSIYINGILFDIVIVDDSSPLHLKNLYSRRSDLHKYHLSDKSNNLSDKDRIYFDPEQYSKICSYKYNILFRTVEEEGEFYNYHPLCPSEITDRFKSFIDCSKFLFSLKKDVVSK